jgi:hypothetical protein
VTTLARIWRWTGHAAFGLMVAVGCLWTGVALWVQLSGTSQLVAWGALAVAGVSVLALRFVGRRQAWAGFAIAAAVVAVWYQTIQPRQDRDWAADVEHGISGTVDGSKVTLKNVRDFTWTSASDATPFWESRTYDLDQLSSVDMVTSTWGDPDIAHLIVSFGFGPGQHIAFSVEIRKEKGESFSTIGGFFREFELVLIAADEADVIKVRTNQRGEDVHMFPVKLGPEKMRSLFMSYLDLGNHLAAQPQFYNTVTANCTSTVYRLVQVIKPDMPLDHRLLLSGQLPEYIDELGGLQGSGPMDARRAKAAISERAKGMMAGADFSDWIRGTP